MAATITTIYEYNRGATKFGMIKVSIPAADILNIYSVPVTALAAPGSGYLISVINLIGRIQTYGGTPYATNTTLAVNYSGGSNINAFSNPVLLTRTSAFIATPGSATHTGATVSFIENEGIIITTVNGNPTAGNSVIEVFIEYEIYKLN